MKTNFLKVLMLVIFGLSTITGFSQENKKETKKNELKTVCFKSSLSCHGCVKDVQENVAYEKGVKDLKVDLNTNLITISYNTNKTNEEKLAASIKKLGYDANKVAIEEKVIK
jgi:copper chaperone CopZ